MNEYTCMNPICQDNIFLTAYKCSTDRPIVYLASKCWNCHKSEFLVKK